jgi:2-keto-4-pentenoate hydratase/2-oxohepta-3-ene-1,7-dioic acid hydratase in catechol pathway
MALIRRPSKIVCVGRNYVAHAAEFGNEVPSEPLIFLKPPSSVIGPGDPIVLPPSVGEVHYEGEIGVLIGRRASWVEENVALDHVQAVVPVNDVTARTVDLDALSVLTRVNGEERQRGRAVEMAFAIPFLISYISRIMTLEPGDLLATGTPEGVGPLTAGDIVEVELTGLEVLKNPVVAREEA